MGNNAGKATLKTGERGHTGATKVGTDCRSAWATGDGGNLNVPVTEESELVL